MFGHSIRTCPLQATCTNWGKLAEGPCRNPVSCVNCGEPHSSDSLTTHIIFLKRVPATGELNIHYALKHTHAFPSHDGLSYADISNRGSRPRLRDPCVWFSPSLSSLAPVSVVSVFISSKRSSVYRPFLSRPLPLLTGLLLKFLWKVLFWMIASLSFGGL